MANILRKIGEEFDHCDIGDLTVWLAIPASACTLLLVGGFYSKVWMIVAAMILITILAITLIVSALYDFFSSWWDTMHSDESSKENPE